jgi:hypothetical protein
MRGAIGAGPSGARRDGEDETSDERRMVVTIRGTQLQDPLALVATAAHELGHVILLGGRLMNTKHRITSR